MHVSLAFTVMSHQRLPFWVTVGAGSALPRLLGGLSSLSAYGVTSDLACFGSAAGLVVAAPANAPVRKYYIVAERELWNFAPNGLVDNCTGTALEGDQTVSCLCIAVCTFVGLP